MVLKRVIITMGVETSNAPEDGAHRRHQNASGKVNPKISAVTVGILLDINNDARSGKYQNVYFNFFCVSHLKIWKRQHGECSTLLKPPIV
jgi:hypothetical protein